MQIHVLAVISAILMMSCGAREPRGAVDSRRTNATAQVFVEALLTEVACDQLATLGEKSFGELTAHPTVASSIHILATDDVVSGIGIPMNPRFAAPPAGAAVSPENQLDLSAHDFRFEVRPRVIEPDSVRLEVSLQLEGRPAPHRHTLATTVTLREQQIVVVPTAFPAPGERRVVLLLKAKIIRDEDDLRRILEDKIQEAELHRSKT